MEVTVELLPLLLYPQRKSLQYPLDRRLGGPWSQTGCYGEEKDLASDKNQTLAVQPIAQYSHNVKINYYDFELILS
jgi:hypothetical protein